MFMENNTLILEDSIIRLSDDEVKSILTVLPNHKKYSIGNIEISPNYSTGYNTKEIDEEGSGVIYISDIEHEDSITISRDNLSDIIDALAEIEGYFDTVERYE